MTSPAASAAPLAAGAPPPESSASRAEPRVRGWFGALLLVAEWVLLFAAIGLWVASKSYSPRLSAGSALLVASWLARWARQGRLTRPTPLDIPLLLFLASAVVGALVAPDLAAALVRLYLLVAAAALFYFLVNAEAASLRLFTYVFVLVAGALGFASQNDWQVFPAKFAIVGSLGQRLGQLVPDLGLYKPHPNVVGSLLALAAPVAAVSFGDEAQAMRRGARSAWASALGLAIFGAGGLAILFGTLMAESRTSWLVLAAAGVLAGWWWLAGVVETRGQRSEGGARPSGSVFWIGVALAVVAVCSAVVARPQLLTTAFGALPGPNSLVSRIEIYGQVWRLAQDTPFTGGGLDSFPAIYSTYILSIPQLFLTHAHNAYLNVLVEQGWPGLIGYASLVVVALWAAAQQVGRGDPELRPFVVSGALGLAVMALHGLGDGVLVASRATPALLIPAGLTLAGWPRTPAGGHAVPEPRRYWRLAPHFPYLQWTHGGILSSRGAGLALVALVVVGAGWLFRQPLAAAWYANLGAVAQARVDLAGWPTGHWDDGSRAGLLAEAEADFEKAVEYQPANRAANYRWGLIAATRRDFTQAAAHLQRAYQVDPRHRGVIKVLGLTEVWLGDYESAAPLLARIPEAHSELTIYVWWWGTQKRLDLAAHASEMAARLGS